MGPTKTSLTCATELPALAFGIEIELLFAFSESHLQEYLQRKSPSATIIKSCSQQLKEGLRSRRYPTKPYNSWALLNAGESASTIQPSVGIPEGQIRAYINEPLELVSEILTTKITHQIFNPSDHSKSTDYSKWTVTSDDSIIALADEEKAAALKHITLDPQSWDTYGIELVSPPFTSLTEAWEQVSTILDLLRGSKNPQYGILVNESCGLHVHIGRPGNEAFPLSTMQSLAELQIIYEEQVSRLHPPHRRNRSDEIESNRIAFYTEGAEPVERTARNENGELVTKLFEPLFKQLGDIRHQIFNPNLSYRELISIMGDERGHILNFCHINRPHGSRTVEFRQHAASISPLEIFWWVRLCLGMVELAGSMAAAGRHCWVESWEDRIEAEDLLAAVGLGKGGMEFYRRKMLEYDDGSEVGVYFVEWVEDVDVSWEET